MCCFVKWLVCEVVVELIRCNVLIRAGSKHLFTFAIFQYYHMYLNYLKGSWSVRQKYIMELMLHNYDSQKWFLLFWPHKRNKNIFINSGAIYQNVTGDRMRYVLAKWRPTSHSSAVRRLFINIGLLAYSRWICMIIIITSLLFISEFLVYQLDSQLNSQPYTK